MPANVMDSAASPHGRSSWLPLLLPVPLPLPLLPDVGLLPRMNIRISQYQSGETRIQGIPGSIAALQPLFGEQRVERQCSKLFVGASGLAGLAGRAALLHAAAQQQPLLGG